MLRCTKLSHFRSTIKSSNRTIICHTSSCLVNNNNISVSSFRTFASLPQKRHLIIQPTLKNFTTNTNNHAHNITTTLQQQQQRNVFIQTAETPNPASVKFIPGVPVLEADKTGGVTSANFNSPLEAYRSPLAKALFKVDGVKGVFLGHNFITVTLDLEKYEWTNMYTFIYEAITSFYQSGKPALQPDAEQNKDTALQEDDDEIIIAIKEILETKVRPMVQEDGGDVVFIKFEDGIVYLQLQGSCTSCPSSTITLKHGIENMMMHYVPEVEEVRQWESEADEASNEQLKKLEDKNGIIHNKQEE